jgi:hypothetical protein
MWVMRRSEAIYGQHSPDPDCSVFCDVESMDENGVGIWARAVTVSASDQFFVVISSLLRLAKGAPSFHQ